MKEFVEFLMKGALGFMYLIKYLIVFGVITSIEFGLLNKIHSISNTLIFSGIITIILNQACDLFNMQDTKNDLFHLTEKIDKILKDNETKK